MEFNLIKVIIRAQCGMLHLNKKKLGEKDNYESVLSSIWMRTSSISWSYVQYLVKSEHSTLIALH